MLPYAKRSPAPEAQQLRSGDFEVVRDTRLGAPRAPKAPPVFHRAAPAPVQAMPAPRYGYGAPTHSNVVLAPEVRADVHAASIPPAPYSAPPASHSLAPVAMSAPYGHAAPTMPRVAPHGSAETFVIRGKPTMKWGIGILAGGALVGALLGVGLNQRDSSAAAASQMTDPEPAVVVAPATPAQAVPQQATVAQGTVAYPAGYQPQAPAPVQAQPVVAPVQAPVVAAPAQTVAAVQPVPAQPGAGYVTAAPQPVVIPPQPAVVVAAQPAPPRAAAPVVHHASRAHKAGKATRSRPAAPPPRVTVAAKVPEPKAEKADKPEPKKRAPRDPDADAILQKAIANTTNTLGG